MVKPKPGSKEEEIIEEGSGSTKKKEGISSFFKKPIYFGLVFILFFAQYFIIQSYWPSLPKTIVSDAFASFFSVIGKQLGPFLERAPAAGQLLIAGIAAAILIGGGTLLTHFANISTESLKRFVWYLFFYMIIVFNIVIGITFGLIVPVFGEQAQTQLECFSKLGPQNPECYEQEVPEAPPVTKAGCEGQNCYNVFELHYGYENDDPPYKAPIIYSEQGCIVDASIKNIAVPERTISGVTVSGKIRDDAQACEREGGCVKLIPKDCTNDAPCEILPTSQSFSVALDCAKPVPFKASTFVDVILETTFPVEAKGSNDFDVYGRAATIQAAKPETTPGPLDIVVYFTPPQLFTTSKNKLVNMFVGIDNKQTGSVVVNKIRIERFSDFPLLDKAKCFPQWDKSITWNEEEDYELDAAFTDRILIICELGVQGPLEAIAPDESQGVKFFAFVDYTYTQRHLEPVKIKQVITLT